MSCNRCRVGDLLAPADSLETHSQLHRCFRLQCTYTSVSVAATDRQGPQPDIEVILPAHGLTWLDISTIHPHSLTKTVAASNTRGTAATLRDKGTHRAHGGHLHPDHTFVSASG
jgi:hypothetical protein